MICVTIGLFVATSLMPQSISEPATPDPMVTFTLTDGWVDFCLEKDGKPLINAKVKILVGSATWADGETDNAGRGTFPRPSGPSCQVVFDLGQGPSAPVPLTFLPDGLLSPSRSPVQISLPECCRIPSRPAVSQPPEEVPESSPAPSWRDWVWVGAAVLVVNVALVGWVLWRFSRATPSTQTTENGT